MKYLVVTIAPDGTTKIETKGYSGETCRLADKDLIAALGQQKAYTPTAEAFQTQTAAYEKEKA